MQSRAEHEDGPAQLEDEAAEFKNGSAELDDGPAELEDGPAELEDGSAELDNGPAELDDGPADLEDAPRVYRPPMRVQCYFFERGFFSGAAAAFSSAFNAWIAFSRAVRRASGSLMPSSGEVAKDFVFLKL